MPRRLSIGTSRSGDGCRIDSFFDVACGSGDGLQSTDNKWRVFGQVAASLNASMTVHDAIEGAVDTMLEGTGVSCGALYAFDSETKMLEARGASGFRLGIRPGIDRHPKRSRSMPSRALLASEPLVFKATDLPVGAAGFQSVTRGELDCIIPEGIRSAAFARVGPPEQPFGVLALCTHRKSWDFDNDWLDLLAMISRQLAVALDRAHQHDAQLRKLAEQDLLQGVGSRLYESTLHESLPRALEFARRSLELSHLVLSPAGQEVPVEADFVETVSAGGRDLADLHLGSASGPTEEQRFLVREVGEMVGRRLRLDQEIHPSLRAVAEARAKVAREVHDGVAQRMYITQLNLTAAAAVLSDTGPAAALVTKALRNSEAGLSEARDLVRRLRSPLAELPTFHAELQATVEAFTNDFGIAYEIEDLTADHPIDGGTRHTIVGITQELLHNVGKHARASLVSVRLETVGQALVLSIADNGTGLPVPLQMGFGLNEITERALAAQGRFTIRRLDQGGTLAELWLPLDQ